MYVILEAWRKGLTAIHTPEFLALLFDIAWNFAATGFLWT